MQLDDIDNFEPGTIRTVEANRWKGIALTLLTVIGVCGAVVGLIHMEKHESQLKMELAEKGFLLPSNMEEVEFLSENGYKCTRVIAADVYVKKFVLGHVHHNGYVCEEVQ